MRDNGRRFRFPGSGLQNGGVPGTAHLT